MAVTLRSGSFVSVQFIRLDARVGFGSVLMRAMYDYREAGHQVDGGRRRSMAVSYTHLTLPTKRIV